MSSLLRGVPVHPNEHSIKRGANFFKVIELLTQLKNLTLSLVLHNVVLPYFSPLKLVVKLIVVSFAKVRKLNCNPSPLQPDLFTGAQNVALIYYLKIL